MQAAKCGITRPAKAQQLADGGFVKAVRSVVDKLTTQSPKDAPLGSGAANQAKQALTTRQQVLDDAEKKAVGMAKGGAVRYPMQRGGEIPGKSPTPTADNIKVDATAGEFMIRQQAADVLGPKVLNALNSLGGDKGKAPPAKKGRGAMRKASDLPDQQLARGGPVLTPAERLAQLNAQAAAKRLAAQSAATELNTKTSLGAAPPSNKINFVMPPEPINATTSPGAAPTPAQPAAPAASTQPRTVPAARVAPQSAVKYSGDPLYPNSHGPAPARPAAGSAPAAPTPAAPAQASAQMGPPKPTFSQRAGQGLKDVTGLGGNTSGAPSKVGAAAAKVGRGALRTAGKLALPVAAGSELVDVGTVATDPNSSGIDVATQAAQGAGRLGAAGAGAGAGAALGTAVLPGVGTVLGGLAGGAAGYFGADKIIEAGRAALGLDPRAPVDQMPQPAAVPAVAAPAAPAAGPAYPENAARHTIAPPASPQAVASAVANPVNPAGAVTRIGNSYSGAPGVSGDITVNGAAPRGGMVRGTGDGTFTYGGTGSGTGGGGGVSDAALHQARLGAIRAGDVEAVKASYAAQGQDFGPKVDPIDALLNNGRPMTTRKAAALAQLQKAKADQQIAEEQRKLERDKFGLDSIGVKLDNEGKAQLGALRKVLVDPKASKADKDAAATSVRALLGKNEAPPVRAFAVPGGQVIDQATGAVTTQPSRVYDPDTKQFISPPEAQSALPPGLVVGAKTKQADGTYQAGGRTVVIQGGKVTEIK